MSRKLTGKQQLFVTEYLVDLNATQAAIRAGYSAKTASRSGPETLGIPCVAAAITEAMNRRSEKTKVTSEIVLAELLRLARADISLAYNENGDLKPIHEIPEDVRRAISGMEIYVERIEGEEIGKIKKIRFWDKTKSLELLGKHLKLFTEKVEMTGKDGNPLQTQIIVTIPSNGRELKKP